MAARSGVQYVSADGGHIPNLGEVKVHFETKDRQRCDLVCLVADLEKPSIAVGTWTQSGDDASLRKAGG